MSDISASYIQYNTLHLPVLSVPEIKPKITAHSLIRRIANHYDIPISSLIGPSRGDNAMVLKRHIAYFVVYKIMRNGYNQTGRAFSKDHTTIVYGIDRIERLCKRDPAFKAGVWELIKMLRGNEDARDSMPVL